MQDQTINQEALTRSMDGLRRGEKDALDTMSGMLYQELRRIAAAQLRREAPGHTLQPTALVHELYLRMAAWGGELDKKSRAHFLATAAMLMRQILVAHARRRNASKRGGGQRPLSLDEGLVLSADGSPEVIALDEALTDLAKTDERKSKVIELRYFGGLSDAEICEVLGVSTATVGREARLGLALLYGRLRGGQAG